MIFATANKHKLREMRELLSGLELEPLPEGFELPPEEGESYAAIALDKARTAHAATGMAAIGDDSGIEAAGRGGRAGRHAARGGGLGGICGLRGPGGAARRARPGRPTRRSGPRPRRP